MMLVISPADFQKLSSSCQQELIALLASRQLNIDSSDDAPIGYRDDEEVIADLYIQQPHQPTADDVVGTKRVVDISVDQARDLVANISDTSKKTLRRFAEGKPVALDEMIGKNCPYSDFNILKRSFVGAVNRRLRTVTGNRLAVLFASDKDKTKIRITPRAAAALRQVLELPEPLPTFEFFDISGRAISRDDTAAKKLGEKLRAAWKSNLARPENGRATIDAESVLVHFLKHGFKARIGELGEWDNETVSPIFSFNSPEDTEKLLHRLEVPKDYREYERVQNVFLFHSETPETLAACEDLL